MPTTTTTKQTIFALVDCNNFFVSCERVFRPDLDNKPVVVLSSNDGCVVARSNEAKQLGIPMGAPAFQWRHLFKDKGVTQFSANFELYSDISRRIVSTLTSVTPRTEVYSIDESFVDLTHLDISDYSAWGKMVRSHILRAIGVPVSIGIASSKTLAKLGADYAKKQTSLEGVLSLIGLSSQKQTAYLGDVPLENIWGVGHRLAPKLRAEGIHTALALSQMEPKWARQLMGLNGLQMVHELNGRTCYELTSLYSPPKSIMRSRTFGEDTGVLPVLEAAVASLAAQAAFQARSSQLLAQKALLFVSTSRHKPGYHSWHEVVEFTIPTSDSGTIISSLTRRLREIFSSNQAYHRAGITLYDFIPATALQTNLLDSTHPATHDASTARMEAIDAINTRFGRGRIRYATEDLSNSWRPKQSLRSPRYVSNWQELPELFQVE